MGRGFGDGQYEGIRTQKSMGMQDKVCSLVSSAQLAETLVLVMIVR